MTMAAAAAGAAAAAATAAATIQDSRTDTGYPHITRDKYGRPNIDGMRIWVTNVVSSYRHHGSIENVIEHFTYLSPAQVHAALTYYYDHQSEIDEEIQADVEESERGYQQQVLPPKIHAALDRARGK